VHPRKLETNGPVNPFPLLTALQKIGQPRSKLQLVNGIEVAQEVAEPLRRLLAAAESAGFILSGAGYRSPAAQIALRRKNCGTSPFDVFVMESSKCRPPTAKPGDSPHHNGTAIDFVWNGKAVSGESEVHRWLVANAPRYEFVTKPSEPWHWEYRPA
jgi:LAS superfamily LD-carboxypeptidase LdcB